MRQVQTLARSSGCIWNTDRGALVRVMEMAVWSPIISLAFPIMYLYPCPIDCTHWTLSLNRCFPEEEWFVYEQTSPPISMTAAASLKWIRMRTWDKRAVRSRKFIFRLLNPFCWPRARCCFQIGRRGTSTQATKHNIVWRSLILPLVSRMKAISVALYRPMWNPQRWAFSFYPRERTKTNFEVPRRRDSKRQCGNVMCYMRHAILIIPLLLRYHVEMAAPPWSDDACATFYWRVSSNGEKAWVDPAKRLLHRHVGDVRSWTVSERWTQMAFS